MSVTAFNKAMESHFKREPGFRNVYVKGEVSEKFISSYDHLYFTLKDKKSVVPCIVYKWFRKNLKFEIENGMKLLVIANVVVYVPHGKYQLDVRSATEDGLGQLYVKLQQLKRKLNDEGLFDDVHKKDLPRFPKRIGVITSRGGSVIHDILKTVMQNWPYCQVFLFPAAVQGASSKRELSTQIQRADASNMDVLIVARGGGSLQDLWSFNEEDVVRTIFNCRTPVISAIGHEDDTTLSDLVSDRRASTPTMAASLAIEDKENISNQVTQFNLRLLNFIHAKVEDYKKQLDFMLSKPVFTDSSHVYGTKKSDFENLCNRFDSCSNELVNSRRRELEKITREYVVRYPCKMQLDSSASDLNELQTRLIDSMNFIINDYRVNLDKAADNFDFLSQKLVTSRRHDLEMMESFFVSNPCQGSIEMSRNELDVVRDKAIASVNAKLGWDRNNLELLLNNFRNASQGLILRNAYELDTVRKLPVIRNPQRIHGVKKDELEMVKNKRTIKNPYLILDRHKRELDVYKEKLDKAGQVIELKREQQRQKAMYMKIIAAIVVVMIIIFILIFGGI